MPLPIDTIPPTNTIDSGEVLTGDIVTKRKRVRSKSINLDKDKVVEIVLRRLQDDITNRTEWMEKRLDRYAKYRGWLEDTDTPWPGADNPHVPVIAWNVLRTISLLHNAVLSSRPVMYSSAWKKVDAGKQEVIDNLLDWQVFIEADGARKLDDFIAGFVEDGVSVAHIPWVKETRTIHDVRTFPPPEKGLDEGEGGGVPPGLPDNVYFAAIMNMLFPDAINIMVDKDGYEWSVRYDDAQMGEKQIDGASTAKVKFGFLDSDEVEVVIEKEAVIYNGPVISPEDLEDIVIPTRCSNLQPPGPSNPRGAPRVARLAKVRLDEVIRRQKDGLYNLLSKDDIKELRGLSTPITTTDGQDDAKILKDEIIGTSTIPSTSTSASEPEILGDKVFTVVESYDRWDMNGDGLEEDVIFWIIKDSKKLARARYLTDIYPPAPGLLPRRPFAEAHFIPIRNQWYSIGMIELLEHLSDIMCGVFKMGMNWGEITNSPFFFYRPTSGMKPDVIRLYPGEGYPVDNPATDINFPQMPGRDQSWAFNMITMTGQMVERLAMQGELQYGRVPTGKSQALRTMGTTVSLMQQADVRADQILLRLFYGIAEIYMQIHSLNQRYLPKDKQYRVVGIPEKGKDVYQSVRDKSEVQGRFDFQWKSTLLSSDKNTLPQTLMEMTQILVNPLTIQSGLMNNETMYKLFREYVKSRHQDPDKFIVRPPEVTDMPKILAEEAIDSIMQGQIPEAVPLEQPMEHMNKLVEFAQSDKLGLFTTQQTQMLMEYMMRVRKLVDQDMQKQQMMQALAQFQQGMGGGTGGGMGGGSRAIAGKNPPGIGENPPIGMNELLSEDVGMEGG